MVSEIDNIKPIPARIAREKALIDRALKLGAVNAKVILTKTITLGNWVRLQCQFGCSHFGKLFTCPTMTPTSHEMSDILMDYRKAIVVEALESGQVHPLVLGLEEFCRQQGFFKAFALEALPCSLCERCTIESHCQHPEKARPTLQACGIDVAQTMCNIGWNDAATLTPCSSNQTVGLVLVD